MYRRHILARSRLLTRRTKWFVYHNLLHADDPPERLARGVAIGVFVTFTPTVGVQMILVLFLAWLLRANKLVGLPIVWITNPVTIVPIYFSCYVIGAMIMGQPIVGLEWWQQLGNPPGGAWNTFTFYWERLETIAVPLWLGTLIIGMVTGALSYFLVFHCVRAYRLRKWGKSMKPAIIRPVGHSNSEAA